MRLEQLMKDKLITKLQICLKDFSSRQSSIVKKRLFEKIVPNLKNSEHGNFFKSESNTEYPWAGCLI